MIHVFFTYTPLEFEKGKNSESDGLPEDEPTSIDTRGRLPKESFCKQRKEREVTDLTRRDFPHTGGLEEFKKHVTVESFARCTLLPQ